MYKLEPKTVAIFPDKEDTSRFLPATPPGEKLGGLWWLISGDYKQEVKPTQD